MRSRCHPVLGLGCCVGAVPDQREFAKLVHVTLFQRSGATMAPMPLVWTAASEKGALMAPEFGASLVEKLYQFRRGTARGIYSQQS